MTFVWRDGLFLISVSMWGMAPVGCVRSTAIISEGWQPPPPRIVAVSRFEIAVGEPLELTGDHFVAPELGYVEVTFSGRFYPDDSSEPEDVEITIALRAKTDGRLTWERFGAYRVPFGRGDRIGRFEGKIGATNRLFVPDGTFDFEEDPSVSENGFPIELTVLPSLVVLNHQPIGESWIADCGEPSLRTLPNLSHVFRVKAIGFEPVDFDFEISPGLVVEGLVQDDSTTIHVPSPTQPQEGVLVAWAPVPEGAEGYRASIHTMSRGRDGVERELHFPVAVRPPLGIEMAGAWQLAQLFEEQAVSSCVYGGSNSVPTRYHEREAETVRRRITTSFYPDWNQRGEVPREVTERFALEDDFRLALDRSNILANLSEKERFRQLSYDEGAGERWSVSVGETTSVGAVDLLDTALRGLMPPASFGSTESWTYEAANGFLASDHLLQMGSRAEAAARHRGEADAPRVRVSSDGLGPSAHIWAQTFGTWFRQRQRQIRVGRIVAADLCGRRAPVGSLVEHDYSWAAGLAIGEQCPLRSGLPNAACLIEPCE